jgi:hypothetical protein
MNCAVRAFARIRGERLHQVGKAQLPQLLIAECENTWARSSDEARRN